MNLFVVAQFGQLIHNEAIIKRDNLANNKLVILYTKANTLVPEKIKNEVDTKLFLDVQLVEIPISPNSISIDNINEMFDIYKELLLGVDNLYLSSFERHYNILHELALRKGVRTHLIEEGLGTYKFANKQFSFKPPTRKESFIRALNCSGFSKNKYYSVLKAVYPWVRDAFYVPYQLYGVLINNKKSEFNSYKLLQDLSDERSAFLDYAKDFHTINLAYPEAVSSFFNAKECNVLNTYSTYESNIDLSSLVNRYEIKDSDILYLSQVFQIPYGHYAEAVVQVILDELEKTDGRCFIKFHPKDKADFVENIKSVTERSEMSERIIVITESDFPIESLIKECQFEKILAISSTALVYANQLSQTTECISVTKALIDNLGSNCPNKTRQLMLEHTEMLSIFKHITFN